MYSISNFALGLSVTQCFCDLSEIQLHVLSAQLQFAPPLFFAVQPAVEDVTLQKQQTCASNMLWKLANVMKHSSVQPVVFHFYCTTPMETSLGLPCLKGCSSHLAFRFSTNINYSSSYQNLGKNGCKRLHLSSNTKPNNISSIPRPVCF